MSDREELAWAAGFFDGEGHIGLEKASRPTQMCPRIQVTQTEPLTLERFRHAVGGLGTINGPYNHGGSDKKPTWRYTTNRFEHAQAVVAALWLFLSAPKRAQIANTIRRYRREHRA